MNSPIKIWRDNKTKYQNLGKIGKIVVATKISTAVDGFSAFAPYWAGIIKLEDGQQITAQLADFGKIIPKKGDRVVGVVRRIKDPDKIGVIEYGIKFRINK